jgi:hypothetical protein
MGMGRAAKETESVGGTVSAKDCGEFCEVAGAIAPPVLLANTSIASRTNPCSRSVGRDSPEHNKASYSNMGHMAHSEVERSSPSSHNSRSGNSRSRKGSSYTHPVDTLQWPDRFGPSQTYRRPAIKPPLALLILS